MINVATKTGDDGMTGLLGTAKRCWKDSARINLIGSIDELSSFLGLAKSMCAAARIRKNIARIQHDLQCMGADIASPANTRTYLRKEQLSALDSSIARLQARGPVKKKFVLYGDGPISAALDVCRALARRCERAAVSLKKQKKIKNACVVPYLNRLSDALFLMAREQQEKK